MAKAIKPADDFVEIIAPLARANEQDLIIGVNGVNYSIPQDGQAHRVPPAVAFEYNRAREANLKFYERQQELHKTSIFA